MEITIIAMSESSCAHLYIYINQKQFPNNLVYKKLHSVRYILCKNSKTL